MDYQIIQRDPDGRVIVEKYENITNTQLLLIFDHQDKLESYEEVDEEEKSKIAEYAIIETVMQKPFIQVFEDSPQEVQMFKQYDLEQQSLIYNYFIEAECYRAASEIDQIIRNGKSEQ